MEKIWKHEDFTKKIFLEASTTHLHYSHSDRLILWKSETYNWPQSKPESVIQDNGVKLPEKRVNLKIVYLFCSILEMFRQRYNNIHKIIFQRTILSDLVCHQLSCSSQVSSGFHINVSTEFLILLLSFLLSLISPN